MAKSASACDNGCGWKPQFKYFPSCRILLKNPGDWSNNDLGYYQIPGYNKNLYGYDDVYYVGDGNFVQCFRFENKKFGIQTNFWNVDDVDQHLVDLLDSKWHIVGVEGIDWYLMDHYYLTLSKPFRLF